MSLINLAWVAWGVFTAGVVISLVTGVAVRVFYDVSFLLRDPDIPFPGLLVRRSDSAEEYWLNLAMIVLVWAAATLGTFTIGT